MAGRGLQISVSFVASNVPEVDLSEVDQMYIRTCKLKLVMRSADEDNMSI